jgi:hypothetical protein
MGKFEAYFHLAPRPRLGPGTTEPGNRQVGLRPYFRTDNSFFFQEHDTAKRPGWVMNSNLEQEAGQD